MTKKNIRPQQVAPVQRETTATSKQSGQGLIALWYNHTTDYLPPFAGDDAE